MCTELPEEIERCTDFKQGRPIDRCLDHKGQKEAIDLLTDILVRTAHGQVSLAEMQEVPPAPATWSR